MYIALLHCYKMDNDGLFVNNTFEPTAEGEEEGKSCADRCPDPGQSWAMGKIVSLRKIPCG